MGEHIIFGWDRTSSRCTPPNAGGAPLKNQPSDELKARQVATKSAPKPGEPAPCMEGQNEMLRWLRVLIAGTFRRLSEQTEKESLYVAAGIPWENGCAESFHSRLRDELLNAKVFADVRDARALAASWRHEYNHFGPHSSLEYVPPAAFAETLAMPPVGATLTRLP